MTNSSYTKPPAQLARANCLSRDFRQNSSNAPRIITYSAYLLSIFLPQLLITESAFAAVAATTTLNFEQGITDGVNPILKLILTHNGKAIFLSSAIGMLLGGGNGSDGWTRLKMGGLWAIGAGALIQIMKGTLGVAMPG